MTRAAVLALAVLIVPACQPSGTSTSRPTPAQQYAVLDLVGDWRWLYRTDAQGTTRVEEENWRLAPDPESPTHLVGRYLRSVEVRSTDVLPFTCNQRRQYKQRALYDVTVDLENDGLRIRETGYDAEDSPCDHGFRHTSEYTADARGNRLALRWPDGTQTLWHVDGETRALPEAPWAQPHEPTGAWRWQVVSYDDDGNLRSEAEWWEISRRTDTQLDATYRRRVTVRSPDGKPIACAGASSWSFDDAYVLRGQREEEHWHFFELAVDAGTHPCISDKRALDEATAEQIGSYFVLEWRGKRRQVLYRPDDE
ncbi:MAG TPA: hypothetical protein VMZ53_18855 [Kofleriaceae bacterium]|nr:hypothetical protein [Kofleriaceae bacterium]